MANQLDELKQTIADVKEVLATPKGASQTVDMEAIKAVVREAMRAEQLERKGDPQGDVVGPEGAKAIDPIVKTGKFAGHRRGDLQFVDYFLRRAYGLRPEGVKLPSPELKAAMSTTDAVGGDLVPVGYASRLWEDIFLASNIVANFGPPIAMPGNVFHSPLSLGDITWYKGTENSATTATQMATDEVIFTGTELVSEVDWSYTLDEAAVVAMLPQLQRRIKISAAEVMDGFVLNADSTDANNINNHDSGNDSDTAYYRTAGQDGIRHQWTMDLNTQMVTASGAALADSHITSAQAKLGKYALPPSDVLQICDIATYLKGFLNLDGVLTLDKYGQNAVLLQGELGRYRGMPIIVSASAPLTQDDGYADGSGDTYGQISLVNKWMWSVGFMRELLIEVDKAIQARQFIMVNSFRIAVACWGGTRASQTHTAGVYYINVA